jgi:Bacteriophage minor capsid protein
MISDPVSMVVRQLIINKGLGVDQTTDTTDDWPVYNNYMPDAPGIKDNLITLTDTSGIKDGRIMRSGQTVIHPGIQVKIRAVDFNPGWVLMDAIGTMFDTIANVAVTVNVHNYVIAAISRNGIFSLGRESEGKERSFIGMNILVTLNQVT